MSGDASHVQAPPSGGAELHPNGDELLCAVAGAMDVHLHEPTGQRVEALRAGGTCLVPRGV